MRIVLSTIPPQAAQTLASRLIDERVAACVNILPGVRSVYRWNGAVDCADEVLLVMKTSDEQCAQLIAFLESEHPYDVPEIVTLDVLSCNAAYAAWVSAETSPVQSD